MNLKIITKNKKELLQSTDKEMIDGFLKGLSDHISFQFDQSELKIMINNSIYNIIDVHKRSLYNANEQTWNIGYRIIVE